MNRKFFWAVMITRGMSKDSPPFLVGKNLRIFLAIARDQFYAVKE